MIKNVEQSEKFTLDFQLLCGFMNLKNMDEKFLPARTEGKRFMQINKYEGIGSKVAAKAYNHDI